MLIKELAVLYIADKREKRRANTIEGYESALKCHVLPRWGHMRIEDIDPDDIQEWLDDFEKPGAAKKAYKTLRQVIRWSIKKMRLRIYDPTTADIELPFIPEPQREALETKDISKFLRGMWRHKYESVAICSVTLGLRPGESKGLKWEDIDLRSGRVHVQRSRQYVKGKTMDFECKTRLSNRVLYLPKFALERMRQIGKGMKGYLIGDANPAQVPRAIKSFCKRNNIPWVSMKNLRHTYATAAIEAGIDATTIAMLLGHTTTTMLQKHYIVMRKTICNNVQKTWQAHIMNKAPQIKAA